MEQHLMVYFCYLNLKGKGAVTIFFMELLAIEDATGENMYLATQNILKILQWNHTNQLVALATNGEASMMGCYYGLTTRLRHNVHVLINTHYIAHRKALLAGDEFKQY